jgi:hypothetical protein
MREHAVARGLHEAVAPALLPPLAPQRELKRKT